MRLPDGRTALLYSVYEAVSNSIHAINDRWGEEKAAEKGRIEVNISLDENGDTSSISVSDNGIGFTDENIESFETSDSRFKYKRGGKGVGRFIWIKMFTTIRVDSVVGRGQSKERIRFRFAPEKANSIAYKRITPAPGEDTLTTITLTKLRHEQKGRVRPASYFKDLAVHFFPQHISNSLPKINITYDGERSSLNDYISDKVDKPSEKEIAVDFGEGQTALKVSHLFVDPSISPALRNAYMLTAHGRLVGDPISIEQKYSLRQLPDGKAYVAIASGEFLDERVDQERLGFKMTSAQRDLLEGAVMSAAEDFLKGHIALLRARQQTTIQGLLEEHPQLATQFDNLEDYIRGLPPGMDEEQIAQNLFVLLYRDERELRKRIDALDHLEKLDDESQAQARETLAEIENQEKHRLAELVVKRHQVLQLANVLLKYNNTDQKTYHYERVLHELICPMREIFRSGEHSRHNLWVVDDSLGTYDFFSSDKPISSFADGNNSHREPDLIFFNPLGFRRPGTSDPVLIVEFKRPGDAKPTQDPVRQVLGYIDDLRNSRVKDIDGAVVSDIGRETPFECIIVCELTAPTPQAFRGIFGATPDARWRGLLRLVYRP